MHAVSDSSYRSDHMSPPALALALLVHAVAAFLLWWLAEQATRPAPPPEPAIEVTIEQPPPKPPAPEPPKPEPPKPEPPAAQPQPPPPSPPVVEGLRPPGVESDRRGQVPGSREQAMNVEDAEPAPQIAVATPPPPTPQPEPRVQQEPQPPQPQPEPEPPQPQAQPDPLPPEPTHPPERTPTPTPQAHAPQPVPAPAPRPEPKPAPQTRAPAPQPPARAAPPAHSPLAARLQAPPPVANPGQSSSTPFVNPADTYNRSLARDNYLWEVVRRLAGYRYHANVAVSQGVTVVRIVVARDGRLLDVGVVRSSGYPELDAGVVAGIRKGAPYSPLPASIAGDRASFDLPLVSAHR